MLSYQNNIKAEVGNTYPSSIENELNLKVFNHEIFGDVRTVIKNNVIWFVAKDVCNSLGISSHRNATAKLDEDEKDAVCILDAIGRNQDTTIINESGLYKIIFTSLKPEAKRFKTWITSEVIPSIRKHGGYLTTEKVEEILLNPDTIIKLAQDLKSEREKTYKLEYEKLLNKPKLEFAKAVAKSSNSILINILAKILRQNGVNIGQNRLFSFLRNNGYLIRRKGEDYNLPTQYALENGWLEVKESVVTLANGLTIIQNTPKVTGKGQIYFVNLFLKALNRLW